MEKINIDCKVGERLVECAICRLHRCMSDTKVYKGSKRICKEHNYTGETDSKQDQFEQLFNKNL